MSKDQQDLPFPADTMPPVEEASPPPLPASASIKAAVGVFEQHMEDEGFALNTRKAFASDVRLLGKYLGAGQPVGKIGTKNLNDFLDWLLNDRGVPCSPKSYARRITTLKVFFAWLHEAGVLPTNPAAAVIQRSVKSPLPTLPDRLELSRAFDVTQAWRQGEGGQKPDARPHLLLSLLYQTAIKKGEAMAIVPNHIDRTNPEEPVLFIRYKNPRQRYKERNLDLDADWLLVLDEYLEQYDPPDTLFTCTARNLEYILGDVGEAAGLEPGLISFENLRWCSARRDLDMGIESDKIRQKLGLSKVTWRETKKKLDRLLEREKQQLFSEV